MRPTNGNPRAAADGLTSISSSKDLSEHGHQLVEERCLYTRQTEQRGNGLYAGRDITANSQLIFVARPLLVALETSKLRTTCYYCFRSPGDSDWQETIQKEQNLKTCSRCKVVKFCDQRCQTHAWSQYHRLECKLYSSLYPRVLPSTARAIIRLLKQYKAKVLPDGEWEQLLALETHQDELAKAGGQRWQDLMIMMQGIQGYSGSDQSPELILRLICALTVNAFTLTNATFDSIGVILHPKPALLNHSCEPNAYVRFDVSPSSCQQVSLTSGGICVFALQDIAKDEEITISYVDTTFPLEKRQQELEDRYFFNCQCGLCVKGLETAQDSYHLLPGLSLKSTVGSRIRENGNEAEKVFLEVQSHEGLEHEHMDEIRGAMDLLARTEAWPVHRYPWPQLRQQLLFGLLGSNSFSEALLHSAVFVRVIHPILFKQEYHPIRLVQTWTFWNLSRHCLETLMEKESPGDREGRELRMLGLLSCSTIDHIHMISMGKDQPKGRLENMIDRALKDVQHEGVFWSEYWRNQAETRRAAWSWVNNQIQALLKGEGVTQEIIDRSLGRVQS